MPKTKVSFSIARTNHKPLSYRQAPLIIHAAHFVVPTVRMVRHKRQPLVFPQHLNEPRLFFFGQSSAERVADDGKHYDAAAL